MKLIFNLVKKDILLAKNYLLLTFITAIIIPIFVNSKVGNMGGSFLNFFIMIIYTQYLLYNSISIVEHKYKGSYLLSATPYGRKLQIKAKYFFILLIFILCFFLYNILSIAFSIPKLTLVSVGLTLLIISIFWGVIIPLQYKFGYEKTKYILAMFIFLTPFLLPNIIKNLFVKGYNLSISGGIFDILLYTFSILFLYISMKVSIFIYLRKDF
ncbi:ABC-2 transporter permease [Marinitoga aeolica]|uniref:ABC-2 transporter permease n=1 Tax=Marinitoga aeolica TaxID=2809031 RepID=A0ABY8PNT9_9BACT|nr:ABC-2 transporter permease [Marinitoga aeolica]WGS64306.1 ABC-2 transporter permease [Marinitoga aeolica]